MDVYFCSTYYHALIACLKSYEYDKKPDIVLLDYIQNVDELTYKMRESGLFNSVIALHAPEFVYNKNLYEKLFTNKIYKSHMKDFDFGFRKYKNIFLFMDDTWIARYCKLEHIQYHLIEDSLDAFKYILNNRYKKLVSPELNHLHKIYKVFPYAEGNHKHFLDSKEVLSIEVNEIKGTIFKETDRLIEVPRRLLFDHLKDEAFLNTVLDIFLEDRNIIDGENIAVVFTSPFYDDKLVDSEDAQMTLYRILISKYPGNTILIKAHPRDIVDYTKLDNVKVIPKNFPSELIAYINQSKIDRFISIASHSVDIYPKEKVDFYELDDVKRWM